MNEFVNSVSSLSKYFAFANEGEVTGPMCHRLGASRP